MKLTIREEHWPLAAAFTLSRGSKTEAHVIVAELEADGARGRGECVPYARYGETVEGVMAAMEAARGALERGADRLALQDLVEPGAARNALDCALWDLEAKRSGVRAFAAAGRARLDPVKTCYTISFGPAEQMARDAAAHARRPLLKLKIGGADDLARVEAVRAAAPKSRLIVDANEGLTFDELRRLAPDLARLDVKLVEQPLPADEDEALEGYDCPVMLCADESFHTAADLPLCARRYGCVNIKLDKCGGLTHALEAVAAARQARVEVMIGCMVATSLSMAPAMLLAQGADFVDLDGPLLLGRDRQPGLRYDGSLVFPPEPELWG